MTKLSAPIAGASALCRLAALPSSAFPRAGVTPTTSSVTNEAILDVRAFRMSNQFRETFLTASCYHVGGFVMQSATK